MYLPDIILEEEGGEHTIVRSFGYEDFEMCL